MSAHRTIEEARQLVAGGDDARALELLVGVWRSCRAARPAELIEALSERVLASRGKDGKSIRKPDRNGPQVNAAKAASAVAGALVHSRG